MAKGEELDVGDGGMQRFWPVCIAVSLLFCGNAPTQARDALYPEARVMSPMGIFWLDYASNANVWRNSTAPDFAGAQMAETRFDVLVGSPYRRNLGQDHTVGVSSVVATHANQVPGPFSPTHDETPNIGDIKTLGYGLRLGWMGQLSSQVTAGLSVQSRIEADRFGVFDPRANAQGDFEIPPAISAGFSYSVSPKLTVAFDWQRVYYSELSSSDIGEVRNISPAQGRANIDEPYDLDIFQIGLSWQYKPYLILRAGINHEALATDEYNNTTSSTDTLTRANLGFSYRPNPDHVLTLSYTHALQGEYGEQHPNLVRPQTGPNLRQNEIEVTWGLSFD